MKLKALLPEVLSRFSEVSLSSVMMHIDDVKAEGKYKNLETRIAWDLMHTTFTPSEICEWYKQYDCNDDHITTLAKEAMHKVFPDAVTYMNLH